MSQTDTSAERRFLIKKNGYYYRPNSAGYTSSAIMAGRYTMEEAEDITHPNGPDGPRDGMSFIADHICPDEDWQAYMGLRKQLATARNDALEEAAYQVQHACLVPPDGGSPTQAEADLCDEAARRIRALKQTQENE